MNKLSTLFLLCCLVAFSGDIPEPSRAKWISYPETAAENCHHERYYRKAFPVSGEVKAATIHVSIDDLGYLQLNGRKVPGSDIPSVQAPRAFQVKDLLAQGQNVLAVTMTNENGIGGVIGRLEIAYADGRKENFYTDLTWKCGRVPEANWNTAAFDDAKWPAPMTYGDAYVQPWSNLFSLADVMSDDERAARQAVYDGRLARGRQILEKLKSEKKPQVSIAYPNGRAHFVIGGKAVPAVLYMTAQCASFDSPGWRDQVRSFAKGGTHLHGISFHARDIWKEGDIIDTARLERDLMDYLVLDPDAFFTVAVSFEWTPKWWVDANRDQCIGYETGEADTNNEFARYIGPSYASRKWIDAVSSVYARVVDFLEASPLAARIFSYRVDTGVYTEWHYYGLNATMPDCSAPMTAAFRDWLARHYDSDEALQKAWNKSDVTRATATTPPAAVRTKYSAGLLRDPIADRWTLDYLACHGEVCRDLVFAFAGTVKRHCGNRALVGQYSGYYFGMSFPAEGWHLRNDDVLNSSCIDFQITPSIYGDEFRKPGASGHIRSLVDSYRLKNKICIIEADTRTCMEHIKHHRYVDTDEQSVQLLARDMAVAFAHGCGIWYYDFGKVWYTLPKLKEYLEKTMPTLAGVKADFGSAADVVFIGDFGSVPYHATEQRPNMVTYMSNCCIAREMGECGVAYDMISFADLDNPRLKDYKVYVFMNAIYLDKAKRAVVDRLKSKGHTLVWLYAPGFLNEKGHDAANVSAVTGINVKNVGGMAKTELAMGGKRLQTWINHNFYYVFTIDDPKAVVNGTLKTEQGDVPAFATKKQKGWTSVLCTSPFLPRQAIQKFCADAGIHRYCDRDDAVVYANKSMVMLHTGKAGDYTLKFTRPATWTQIFPVNREFKGKAKTRTVKAGAGETYFFLCK